MDSIRFPRISPPCLPVVPMASQPHPFRPAAMREQLLHECVAMARYALASGMPVPAPVADAIEKARFAEPGETVPESLLRIQQHGRLGVEHP